MVPGLPIEARGHLIAFFFFTGVAAVALGADIAPRTTGKGNDSPVAPGTVSTPPQPVRPKRVLPGTPVELKTKDGWTLSAVYSPAQDDKLTIVLLHQAGGRKDDWYWLGRAMTRQGIGYLAVDLRGHAGSQNPPSGVPAQWRQFRTAKDDNEWVKMTLDVEAAVDYLLGRTGQVEPPLPESRIGLGGADVGGSVALKYAAVHKLISMFFWLSPGMSYREVLTVNAMRVYGPRPALMVVSSDDKRSSAETAILFHFAKLSAGPENVVQAVVDKNHGTRMLAVNKGLVTRIVDWIENPVQPLELPPELSTGTETDPGAVAPTEGAAQDGLPTDEDLAAGAVGGESGAP